MDDRRVIGGILRLSQTGIPRQHAGGTRLQAMLSNRFRRWAEGSGEEKFFSLAEEGFPGRVVIDNMVEDALLGWRRKRGGAEAMHRALARRLHEHEPSPDRCLGTPFVALSADQTSNCRFAQQYLEPLLGLCDVIIDRKEMPARLAGPAASTRGDPAIPPRKCHKKSPAFDTRKISRYRRENFLPSEGVSAHYCPL